MRTAQEWSALVGKYLEHRALAAIEAFGTAVGKDVDDITLTDLLLQVLPKFDVVEVAVDLFKQLSCPRITLEK